MYELEIKTSLRKKLKKLGKKNPKQVEIIVKKLEEVLQNPQHYKNLRKPLQNWKRVHIDKSFVLVFKINHKSKVVDVYYFDHHDKVYQWRPSRED